MNCAYAYALLLFLLALAGFIGYELGQAQVISQFQSGHISHESQHWQCRAVPEWL